MRVIESIKEIRKIEYIWIFKGKNGTMAWDRASRESAYEGDIAFKLGSLSVTSMFMSPILKFECQFYWYLLVVFL